MVLAQVGRLRTRRVTGLMETKSNDGQLVPPDSLEVLETVIREIARLSDSEKARVVSTVCAYFRLRAHHLNIE